MTVCGCCRHRLRTDTTTIQLPILIRWPRREHGFGIGLAHGPIRDFGSRGEANNQVLPTAPTDPISTILRWGIGTASARSVAVVVMLERPRPTASGARCPGTSCSSISGAGAHVTPIRTGRYKWLIREWRVNDAASFYAEPERFDGRG
jgi:hypothetical protein